MKQDFVYSLIAPYTAVLSAALKVSAINDGRRDVLSDFALQERDNACEGVYYV